MSYKSILAACVSSVVLGGCVYIDADEQRPDDVSVIRGAAVADDVVTRAAATVDASPLAQQAEAQRIVTRAVDAAGGLEALERLRDGQMTFSVRAARVGQDLTPDAVPSLGDASRTVALRANGLTAIERFNGDDLGSRYVHGGLVDWIYFAGQNSVADVEPVLAAGIIAQSETSAHVLLGLVDRSEALRAAGSTARDGVRHDMVSYSDRLGRTLTAYFNSSTGELASVDAIGAHAQWGDTVTGLAFSDYRTSNGVRLAHLATTRQAGAVVSETRLEAVDLIAPEESVFAKPEGATENDPFTAGSTAPRQLTVEALAPGIHFIENAAQGYNVIFVDQSDGVLILETPQSIQASRDVIRTIGEALPGKALKAAVPTHHHFDHSGGLYGYLEAGVPILTTPGNANFVRGVGTADRNIGRSSGAVASPEVSTFDGRTTLGTGGAQVELINVGPNPHADEIVIAYIPAIKAVFVADIFSRRGDELPPANENQLAFADKLETLGLDVETFIPVHGTNATAVEFWASVEAGRAALAEAG